MHPRVALDILVKLIEGVDPQTGKELASNCILHRAPILRALLVEVLAIQGMQTRTARRSQLPPKVGGSWDAAEEAELVTRYKSGMKFEDIAQAHERTVRAIQLRLERLGLLAASSSFSGSASATPAPVPNEQTGKSDAEYLEAQFRGGTRPP